MSLRQDSIFILSRSAYGESSLVLHALGAKGGREHLLAKGAYRPKSRFFAAFDLFHTIDVQWDQRPSASLGIVRSADPRILRRHIPLDLARYRVGCALLELVDLVTRPGQAEPFLYPALSRALDLLDQGQPTPGVVLLSFELALIEHLGLAPALEHCAHCGVELEPAPAPDQHWDRQRVAFSAGAGGRLCPRHASEARAAGRRVGTLPATVLGAALSLSKVLAADAASGPLARGPVLEAWWVALAPEPSLARELLPRLLDLVERFLDFHLESTLHSRAKVLAGKSCNAPLSRP